MVVEKEGRAMVHTRTPVIHKLTEGRGTQLIPRSEREIIPKNPRNYRPRAEREPEVVYAASGNLGAKLMLGSDPPFFFFFVVQEENRRMEHIFPQKTVLLSL